MEYQMPYMMVRARLASDGMQCELLKWKRDKWIPFQMDGLYAAEPSVIL